MFTIPPTLIAPGLPPPADKWLRGGQVDSLSIFGVTCEEIYQPGVPASGPMTGIVASNVFNPTGAPTFRQPFTGLPNDPLGIKTAHASNDGLVAANVGTHNYGSGAFFELVTFLLVTWPGTTNRHFFGNLGSTGDGCSYIGLNTLAQSLFYGDVANRGVGDIWDKNLLSPRYAAQFRRDESDPNHLIGTISTIDVDTLAGYSPGNITSTNPFAFGKGPGSWLALGAVWGPSIFFSGASALHMIGNYPTLLANWWAMPS